jgi:hypothetical protein
MEESAFVFKAQIRLSVGYGQACMKLWRDNPGAQAVTIRLIGPVAPPRQTQKNPAQKKRRTGFPIRRSGFRP